MVHSALHLAPCFAAPCTLHPARLTLLTADPARPRLFPLLAYGKGASLRGNISSRIAI